jgi:heme/copper-type cytochrome/quinol oxidase subunit 1
MVQSALPPSARRIVLAWVTLAVGALALAGLLAALLAASRAPGVSDYVPLQAFRRALVTHVILSFVVWYLLMLGAYSSWALARIDGQKLGTLWDRAALFGVAVSLILLLVPAFFGLGTPSLNDYLPVIDHPLFLGGVGLLLVSVALPVLRLLSALAQNRRAAAPCWAIAAAGVAYLAALACFALAWGLGDGLMQGGEAAFQTLFWGGGHVLQFVHSGLILVIWWQLLEHQQGRPPAPSWLLVGLCGAMALVALVAPGLYGLYDLNDGRLSHAFTLLYKLGLIAQPAVGMVVVAWALLRRGIGWRQLAGSGVALSWLLFALGGVMGYTLTDSDTRTPAHYHAMIGAVTLAHMVMLFVVLLPALGRAVSRPRWAMAMVWCYAVGQGIHCLGLYGAGLYGIARKTAGQAQGLEGGAQKTLMALMGLGGGVAVIGGVIFVILALRTCLRKVHE